MSIIDKPKQRKKTVKVKTLKTKTAVSVKPVNVKQEMREMLDRLPDDLTWERLIYHIKVRIAIEEALKEADEGDYITEEEMNEKWDNWEREHLTPEEIEELDRWEREELKSFG